MSNRRRRENNENGENNNRRVRPRRQNIWTAEYVHHLRGLMQKRPKGEAWRQVTESLNELYIRQNPTQDEAPFTNEKVRAKAYRLRREMELVVAQADEPEDENEQEDETEDENEQEDENRDNNNNATEDPLLPAPQRQPNYIPNNQPGPSFNAEIVRHCVQGGLLKYAGRTFRIPYFQRSYQWRNKEINDMLDSWFTSFQLDSRYDYMGNIICWEKDTEYYVIDGQQRLTTVMIFWSTVYWYCYTREQPDINRSAHQNTRQNRYVPFYSGNRHAFWDTESGLPRLHLRNNFLNDAFHYFFLPDQYEAHNNDAQQFERFQRFVVDGQRLITFNSRDNTTQYTNYHVRENEVLHKFATNAKQIWDFLDSLDRKGGGGLFGVKNFAKYVQKNVRFTLSTVSGVDKLEDVRAMFLRLNETGQELREADKVKVSVLTRLRDPRYTDIPWENLTVEQHAANQRYQESQAEIWEKLEGTIVRAGEAYSKIYKDDNVFNKGYSAFEHLFLELRIVVNYTQSGNFMRREFADYFKKWTTGGLAHETAATLWSIIKRFGMIFLFILDPFMDQANDDFSIYPPPLARRYMQQIKIILHRCKFIRYQATTSGKQRLGFHWHKAALVILNRYWYPFYAERWGANRRDDFERLCVQVMQAFERFLATLYLLPQHKRLINVNGDSTLGITGYRLARFKNLIRIMNIDANFSRDGILKNNSSILDAAAPDTGLFRQDHHHFEVSTYRSVDNVFVNMAIKHSDIHIEIMEYVRDIRLHDFEELIDDNKIKMDEFGRVRYGNKSDYHSKTLKYLLLLYESSFYFTDANDERNSIAEFEALRNALKYEKIDLDHIRPKSQSEVRYNEDDYDEWENVEYDANEERISKDEKIHCIGNLCLLESDKNRSAGNLPFKPPQNWRDRQRNQDRLCKYQNYLGRNSSGGVSIFRSARNLNRYPGPWWTDTFFRCRQRAITYFLKRALLVANVNEVHMYTSRPDLLPDALTNTLRHQHREVTSRGVGRRFEDDATELPIIAE